MTNGPASITGLELIDTDIAAGNSYPKIGLRQGTYFGWMGSAGRYTSSVPKLGIQFQMLEELLTVAAAASSTTANTSILPTNSLIHVVMGRVTVAIPTAATFTVGDASQASRFATGVAVAINTTFTGFLHWNLAVASDALGPRQTANAGIKVTPNATPGTAVGRVALQAFSQTFIPPTA